jgi:colanic acid biosynthesis glycosyl transferase WcaI
MRYVVHDYSGHPFQVHLSRHLAMRGHDVTHLYAGDHPGPKGWFDSRPSDPPHLQFVGVTTRRRPATTAAGTGAIGLGRIFHELAYGREVARAVQWLKPDVVLCGNTPADAQRAILKTCEREGVPFVYWLQDIYSVAVSVLLTKKLGVAGAMIGSYYRWLDRQQFRASDAIIAICEDFSPLIAEWVGETPISVIENWAGIADLPVCDKNNEWSRSHNLHETFTFLYSGTLGRKHNPGLLLKLAKRCGLNESVVAVAQGFGVPLLQSAKTEQGLNALKLLPLQPAQVFANVLGTADVLIATIESDAGTFAVPSKVLSYLCSGRPILIAASKNNLAARTVERANAGVVVSPEDPAGFLAAAERLRDDPALRAELGANARAYAERMFDLESITDKFEMVLAGSRTRRVPTNRLAGDSEVLVAAA